MDTLWRAGVWELGKRVDEHRWTRRRKKQTIWQPLLPDVHWSPILNELHKQNGPLGHKKAIKSDQGDFFERNRMQRAMTHFFINFRLTQNNTFALNTETNLGWPCLGLLRLTHVFSWLLRSKRDNSPDDVSSTWDGNKSALEYWWISHCHVIFSIPFSKSTGESANVDVMCTTLLESLSVCLPTKICIQLASRLTSQLTGSNKTTNLCSQRDWNMCSDYGTMPWHRSGMIVAGGHCSTGPNSWHAWLQNVKIVEQDPLPVTTSSTKHLPRKFTFHLVANLIEAES